MRQEQVTSSHFNWANLIKRADLDGTILVGVDHFKAGKHQWSPFRRKLLYSKSKVTFDVKSFAYESNDNFDWCWKFGLFIMMMHDDQQNPCESPLDDWRAWVKENLSFMVDHR